ncbi:hypothetical protein ACFQRL_00140 [Microbacterium fluvii]|uniref:Solute-binding protein family 3/N-terminal domain-containing protein n=1 Tax=Microbacterium fluvii TaxID=415215 RepID=A0ABW2H7L9_9MICO|nr:hypothetical protein [Microbacterium fluvii]MCU4670994.1 hypothetical protein [Microbacterium fluvii]
MRSTTRVSSRLVAAVAVAALALLTAGCGISIPTDPDGTLGRIATSGELRVGATPAGRALVIDEQNVTGPLADAIEGFARANGAHVDWVVASEETIVDDLEHGELDLGVGGITEDTPWGDRVSVSRGYTGIDGSDGRALVVLMPLGENALQTALETYLDEEVGP